MSEHPLRIREYFEAVGIDPNTVKEHLGTGTQFQVHALEDPDTDLEMVVKGQIEYLSANTWTRFLNSFTRQPPEEIQKEYDLSCEYFDAYPLRTKLQQLNDDEKYALKQPRLRYQRVTPAVIRSSRKVRWQLEDIFEKNGQLLQDHDLWMDFAGMDTWKILKMAFAGGDPYTDNVVMVENEELKIIDTGLFGRDTHALPFRFQELNAELLGFRFTGSYPSRK